MQPRVPLTSSNAWEVIHLFVCGTVVLINFITYKVWLALAEYGINEIPIESR